MQTNIHRLSNKTKQNTQRALEWQRKTPTQTRKNRYESAEWWETIGEQDIKARQRTTGNWRNKHKWRAIKTTWGSLTPNKHNNAIPKQTTSRPRTTYIDRHMWTPTTLARAKPEETQNNSTTLLRTLSRIWKRWACTTTDQRLAEEFWNETVAIDGGKVRGCQLWRKSNIYIFSNNLISIYKIVWIIFFIP